MRTTFKPGSLVTLYHRDWVVLPAPSEDLLLLKPMDGTDHEIKGIFLPLHIGHEQAERATFPLPSTADLGNFASARLLYNAARLSFRNGAGPFRSMGRLSFQPRSYQLVPLIMALRLETVRLLIADDVGIGKTIEALLIAREKLDRGEIQRFAVVCLPHLCDQWRQEMKDKFGLDAVLIRSSTIKQLEKKLGPNESVFERYPYQVISIDYIKGDKKRGIFLANAPDLVIVDEAHTCAQPESGQQTRQQRHQLIRKLAENPKQHLLLLTATPHSGKAVEFQSILGLLRPHFAQLDLANSEEQERKEVAKHFVQRRRKNVEQWLHEKTDFPQRESLEQPYRLSEPYRAVFEEVLKLAQKLARGEDSQGLKTGSLRYYLAIGLIRGVMSSPAAGESMLRKKLKNAVFENEEEHPISGEQVFDGDHGQEDRTPTALTDRTDLKSTELQAIRQLTKAVDQLRGFKQDHKAAAALAKLRQWMKTNNTMVFCRYIQTAKYLGDLLKPALKTTFGSQFVMEVITSELSDEERRERVHQLQQDPRNKKLLIATDCMSEGINLQEKFSAVLHYDLPWNPNRLEQREGRVDRFGQPEKRVRAALLYGEDNPMDGTVLKVLLRKARTIRNSIGISVPFSGDSKSIMDAVFTAVLLRPKREDELAQMTFNFGQDEAIRKAEIQVETELKAQEDREIQMTDFFAQNQLRPEELVPYLEETDLVLGNAQTVEKLLQEAMPLLACSMEVHEKGFVLDGFNLPPQLKPFLPEQNKARISFASPTPSEYHYIGRNHNLTENLCLYLLDAAFSDKNELKVARASVFRSNQVTSRTTLFLLRIRNVIANQRGQKELVAEEMLLWGFEGRPESIEQVHTTVQAMELLEQLQPTEQVPPDLQARQLAIALEDYNLLKSQLDQLATQRAEHMVNGHEHFRKAIRGDIYRKVEPILPPDVLGVYVILPKTL